MSGKKIYLEVQNFKTDKINCTQLNNFIIFDARTKKEFEKFHIPKAIHIPLVSNEEFHEVGYLYKQVSPDIAYELGFNYIYKNVPEIIQKANKYKNKKIVVCCARGGIRSKTIVYLLKTQGFNVVQLKDGMKAYRNFILKEFETIRIPKLIILQGLAGSRKTKLINNLKNSIDLEGCAKHNSSTYGALDHEPNSQKQFSFELYHQLMKLKGSDLVFIEGEARKIGDVTIPKRLWEEMNKSKTIFLDVSLDNRAQHFTETYPDMKTYSKQYIDQTNMLKQLISNKLRKELIKHINENKPCNFWKLILKDHYDLKYNHSFKNQKFEITINANNFKKTLEYLKKIK